MSQVMVGFSCTLWQRLEPLFTRKTIRRMYDVLGYSGDPNVVYSLLQPLDLLFMGHMAVWYTIMPLGYRKDQKRIYHVHRLNPLTTWFGSNPSTAWERCCDVGRIMGRRLRPNRRGFWDLKKPWVLETPECILHVGTVGNIHMDFESLWVHVWHLSSVCMFLFFFFSG